MKKIEDMTKRELADALMGATAARRFWIIQAIEDMTKRQLAAALKSEYNNAKSGSELGYKGYSVRNWVSRI